MGYRQVRRRCRTVNRLRPLHQLNTAECRPWAHDHPFRKCVRTSYYRIATAIDFVNVFGVVAVNRPATVWNRITASILLVDTKSTEVFIKSPNTLSHKNYIACRQSAFIDVTLKTFATARVLPTRWRRKPAGTEITSLPPYV